MTGFSAAFAAVLASAMGQEAEPIDLPVMYEAPYVLRTEITRSVRKDAQPPVVTLETWEVSVTPTDEGFRTIWRDLAKRQAVAMEIETNEQLLPVRIANLDAVRAEMAAALRVDDKDGTGERVLSFFNSMPEATLTALLTQSASLVALGQGRSLTPGAPTRYTQDSQPFADGPVVISQAAFELQSLDEATGHAVVIWSSELDEKAMAGALPALVRAVAGPMGVDPTDQSKMEDAFKGASFTKSWRCRYDIEIETGLASTVSCTTVQEVVVLGERSKTETRLDATQTLAP